MVCNTVIIGFVKIGFLEPAKTIFGRALFCNFSNRSPTWKSWSYVLSSTGSLWYKVLSCDCFIAISGNIISFMSLIAIIYFRFIHSLLLNENGNFKFLLTQEKIPKFCILIEHCWGAMTKDMLFAITLSTKFHTKAYYSPSP